MEDVLADSQGGAENYCTSLWCVVDHVYDKGGIGVLSFLLLSYAFYRLVWKVWRFAIRSKDAEIERLIKERNYLQSKLFSDRQSSD